MTWEEQIEARLAAIRPASPVTLDAPRLSYDAATDSAVLALQEAVDGSGRVHYLDAGTDIELQFDATRLGRLCGVIVRSPTFARTDAWQSLLDETIGITLARHVRAIAMSHDDAYDIRDLKAEELVELRLHWIELHEESRAARRSQVPCKADADADPGRLLAAFRDMVALGRLVPSKVSSIRLGLEGVLASRGALVDRGPSAASSTLIAHELPRYSAELFGLRRSAYAWSLGGLVTHIGIQLDSTVRPVGALALDGPVPGRFEPAAGFDLPLPSTLEGDLLIAAVPAGAATERIIILPTSE